MLDFHEKRKLRTLLYSKPAIALLIGIIVFMSLSVYERYSREREMASKRYELAERLTMLEGQAASLEGQVERLKSDRGIEEELRDRFEVAKNGEEVIVIVGEKQSSSTAVSAPIQPKGFFTRLKGFLTQ